MAESSVDSDTPVSQRDCAASSSFSALTDRPRHGVLVGNISGALDMVTVPAFADYLRGLVNSTANVVVLDLTAVSFLGVEAIKTLAQEDLRAHIVGKRLSLVTGVRAVDRPLEVLGMDHQFTYGSKPVFAESRSGDGKPTIPASRTPAQAEQMPALSGWAAGTETC